MLSLCTCMICNSGPKEHLFLEISTTWRQARNVDQSRPRFKFSTLWKHIVIIKDYCFMCSTVAQFQRCIFQNLTSLNHDWASAFSKQTCDLSFFASNQYLLIEIVRSNLGIAMKWNTVHIYAILAQTVAVLRWPVPKENRACCLHSLLLPLRMS